ncbi:MAG: low-specificity L-threonine aldolase [Candidatus Latescibacteria bacterium 4484_7]|nr:MAG: low-specificity L-threonine aldolase [Candidatus Latescibacteria bacterium 4484_7]
MIDLRSDTVTRPSEGMRKAIARAPVGDDVLGDDPTVKELEARMAAMFGKEAALYVPSGTMSNTLAVLSQTRPGDEMICDKNCHIFNYEAAATAVIGGVQLNTLDGNRGVLPFDDLVAAVRPINIHHPRTSLIEVENTHNRAGGSIYPYDELERVSRFARESGLRLHMDGARLANAVVGSGISFEKYASLADSVTFCFSKGLGAPVGSILVSDAEVIERARFWRKRLGGGMRQAGILAAACLYALDNNIDRLAEDHENAGRIAKVIDSSSRAKLVFPVETNIIIFEVVDKSDSIEKVREELEAEGILTLTFGNRMRMVTHLDVSSEDTDVVVEVLSRILSQAR